MYNSWKSSFSSRALLLPAGILVLLLLLAATFTIVLRQLEAQQESTAQRYFREIVTQSAGTVRANLQYALHPVQEVAGRLSEKWPLNDSDMLLLLNAQPLLGKFKRVGVCLLGGRVIGTTPSGRQPLPEHLLFAETDDGKASIGQTVIDNEDGLSINIFTAPVMYQDKVAAVVFATMDSALLQPLMEMPLFSKQGGSFIIDRAGTGISQSFGHVFSKNSLFEGLSKTNAVSPPAHEWRALLENGSAGGGKFTHRNREYYAAFAPLEINDWFVIGFIPAHLSKASLQNVMNSLHITLAATGVLCLALLAYVLWQIRRQYTLENRYYFRLNTLGNCLPGGVLRCRDDAMWTLLEYNQGLLDMLGFTEEEIHSRFHNQFLHLVYRPDRTTVIDNAKIIRNEISSEDRPTLEYRLECKNGSHIWVTEYGHLIHEGSETHWCIVLLDSSGRRNALERRMVEEKRYRILFEMSEAILYEYDMRNGILFTMRQFFDKFGYPQPENLNPLHPVSLEIFHPEDLPTFKGLQQSLLEGQTSAEALLRIYRCNGEWLWCHVQQTALRDSSQKCIKALGRITDVDAETRVLYQLREEMQRDPFTGLYNKVATASLVDEELYQMEKKTENGKIAALCIVDVDNFKSVNDRLGHDKGDEVLKTLADTLASYFSSNDIVGRVGGDEFMVFVRDISHINMLSRKVSLILESLKRTLSCPDGAQFQLSVSVGIALCPQDGTRFSVLYPRADKALYRSKKSKNTCTFYDAQQDETSCDCATTV